MAEDKALITLLKKTISQKKQDVKEYSKHLDQNLAKKIELLDNLKNDVNEISKIDMSQINDIIASFKIPEEEKISLKRELDTVKALLTLNQTEKTTYTLMPSQLAAITVFLDNLESYIEEANQEKQVLDPEYNHIITITKHYKNLLSKIKNPNSKELITDIDTITQLFQENKLSEEDKQAILLAIIKYNQEVVKAQEKEKKISSRKLTKKEISSILERYGYNFQRLDPPLQEQLQKQANRKQVEEVLSTMQKLQFPKIDEQRQGLLLATYLLATTKQSLEEVVSIGQNRGINITTLSQLVSAFIPKKYLYDGYDISRKEDFKKNLTLLGEHGISIPLVAEKEKELLVLSSSKLQNNLEWLERYGLYSSMQEEALLDDFLSALKSQNIPEIIDLWIENHSLGLLYIKNNLSALSSYITKNSLLFFKLYKAEKDHLNDAFRMTLSNGVKKLSLRKEMTKDNLEYHGIYNIESAITTTDYRAPFFMKEPSLEKIAKDSTNNSIHDNIFEKPEIASLNRFSSSKDTLLYDINGLKISKLKVLRIYDALCQNNLGNTTEALLYAICYNKIITKEEYQNLKITIQKVTGMKEV